MKDPAVTRQIEDSITNHNQGSLTGNLGMIVSYNRSHHTATVLLASRHADRPGQTIGGVPCPFIPGVQYTAPEPGRMCWVEFRGVNQQSPVITHFFSPTYAGTDYEVHNHAPTSIPKFIVDM